LEQESSDEIEIKLELGRYIALLRQWWWLLILAGLLGASIAFAVSKFTVPVYAASASLWIDEGKVGQTTLNDLNTSEKQAKTYAQLLVQHPVLEEAANALKVPVPLDRQIKVTAITGTSLLDLTIESTDPQLAADFANILPEIFRQQNLKRETERFSIANEDIQKQLIAIEQQIAANEVKLEKATNAATESRLQSALAQDRQTRQTLLSNYAQLQLAASQSVTNITVTEPAVVPTQPVRPNVRNNTLIGAVLGLFLAIAVLFGIDYLDDTFKSPDAVQSHLDLSVLGTLLKLPDESADNLPIAIVQPRAPATEAYRILRTNIQFSSLDKPLQRILITSSGPGEGKSTIASNLAVVLAQEGRKVILVDCDLRKPTIHKRLKVANRYGVSDLMLQSSFENLNDFLLETDVPTLKLLTTGAIPPNPAEMLSSEKMERLLTALQGVADVLVIDAPPVSLVTDAMILARKVDGVLLVVDAVSTKVKAAAHAVEQLHRGAANVFGVALNRLDLKKKGYYYYGGYYYHNYQYYGESAKPQSIFQLPSWLQRKQRVSHSATPTPESAAPDAMTSEALGGEVSANGAVVAAEVHEHRRHRSKTSRNR
jgi:succinoglycan biosynthesis transport protein ExoP